MTVQASPKHFFSLSPRLPATASVRRREERVGRGAVVRVDLAALLH